MGKERKSFVIDLLRIGLLAILVAKEALCAYF